MYDPPGVNPNATHNVPRPICYGPPQALSQRLSVPDGFSPFRKSLADRTSTASGSGETRSVPQSFKALFSALEITEAERQRAIAQRESVKKKLITRLTLLDTLLSGSYKRRTLIRPLDDIDLLVVFDAETYASTIARDAVGARRILDLLEAAVRDAYPYSEIKRWARCVQIQFAGTGIGFDLVPAFDLGDDVFLIPDTDEGRWLRTNPREVQRLLSAANQHVCGEWLVPLTKVVKRWKDHRGAPLRGFHLEAMLYRALQHTPTNEREGLAYVFGRLAIDVLGATPDIWWGGENADAYLTLGDRLRASNMFAEAEAAARRAIAAEADGRTEDAHQEWFALFGDDYPETGQEREEAVAMDAWAAIKAVRAGAYVSASSNGLVYPAVGYAGARSSTSHGGVVDEPESIVSCAGADSLPAAQRDRLELEISTALAQFPALRRVNPAEAAADPCLWPVRADEVPRLYAVLVGEQRTNFGARHRILVKVPMDAPATEPRIYRLKQHVTHTPRGRAGRPRFVPRRRLRHQWYDGAMCTHARRDRWDGRLVTLLVYAADWLLRQDYHQLTGRWIGREIGPRGELLVNGRPPGASTGRSRTDRRVHC